MVYGDVDCDIGEGEATVGTKAPGRQPNDATEVWRQIGELLVRGQAQTGARFDRVESELMVLREQVNRLEMASVRQTNRVDAQFEQLRALIIRRETKG